MNGISSCAAAWLRRAHKTGSALLVAAFAAGSLSAGASAQTPSQTLEAGDLAQVSQTGGVGLRVRYGPSLGYYRHSALAEGQTVRVVEGPVANNGYNWYKVTGFDALGTTGWSAGNWLVEVSAPAPQAAAPAVSAAAPVVTRPAAPVPVVTRPAPAVSGPSYNMLVTGYNGAEFNSNGIMRNGQRVYWGAVAVDPNVIPLGTRMHVSGYGDMVFVASDTGSAIKGYRLDIWFPTLQQAINFGAQRRTVTIIR